MNPSTNHNWKGSIFFHWAEHKQNQSWAPLSACIQKENHFQIQTCDDSHPLNLLKTRFFGAKSTKVATEVTEHITYKS